jgi:hypothetical protein
LRNFGNKPLSKDVKPGRSAAPVAQALRQRAACNSRVIDYGLASRQKFRQMLWQKSPISCKQDERST